MSMDHTSDPTDEQAIEGLDSAAILRARTSEQYGQCTVLLAALLQVLAFAVFMETALTARYDFSPRSVLIPHALYTLGSIITVTYVQMTIYPLLRWTLAPPDIALVFLAAIAQVAAARLMLYPAAWWGAVAVLHLAASAAYFYAYLRLRPFHLGGAMETYRGLRRALPLIGAFHALAIVAALMCATAMPKTALWTWTVIEAISIVTVIIQVYHERFLASLYRENGLSRFMARS